MFDSVNQSTLETSTPITLLAQNSEKYFQWDILIFWLYKHIVFKDRKLRWKTFSTLEKMKENSKHSGLVWICHMLFSNIQIQMKRATEVHKNHSLASMSISAYVICVLSYSLLGLMPDLRWSWCNNTRNKVHNKCNALESSRNHPPPSHGPWKNCLPWNQSLVPERLGIICYSLEMRDVCFFHLKWWKDSHWLQNAYNPVEDKVHRIFLKKIHEDINLNMEKAKKMIK